MDVYEMEVNWRKLYYGRCIECGQGWEDKEEWRNEYDLFSFNVTDDIDIIEKCEMVAWNNQQHEGNGVCYQCLCEIHKEMTK
jgi:hypothetical protein